MPPTRSERTAAAAHALLVLAFCAGASAQVRYFGLELDALSQLQHGVRGRVYLVDARTIYIKDFHYDGEGPAAYFFLGKSDSPDAGGVSSGTRLRDERGGSGPLRRYRGESITLSLPDGATVTDFKWISVWCDEFNINFGSVSIPRGVTPPRPARVGALRGVHGVSSDPVVVVDAQTLLVPNFSYDGEAPDAKFWVGRGAAPSLHGIRIPDENGKETPLRRYDKKTIVLTLPGELTVFDIGHFAVWCEAFTVNFGHVPLPRAVLSNVPPSLKMLGVSPQSRNKALAQQGATSPRPRTRKPIAKVDATTYRPQLRPGSGLLASLLAQPADSSALHRRAYDGEPRKEQLVTIQSSKELNYTDSDEKQGQEDEIVQKESEARQQHHNTQEVRNYRPESSSLPQREYRVIQPNQQSQYTDGYQQNPYYQPTDDRDYFLTQITPNYQALPQQVFYHPQDPYQQFERQRALELRDQYQGEPFQYRLLPYDPRSQ